VAAPISKSKTQTLTPDLTRFTAIKRLACLLIKGILLFYRPLNSITMSLIPNKKNKKDSRPGGGQPSAKPGAQNAKGKANTKAATRNTKLTGGSQRGS
jgi:hypothetical protein